MEYRSLSDQEFARSPRLEYFYDWTLHKLPAINSEILEHGTAVEPLIDEVRKLVKKLPEPNELDIYLARESLQYLGFAISSVERHTQDRKANPGEGLRAISASIEQTLAELGKIGRHPPRDTVYTFALWNDPQNIITFTGDPQEELFIDIVQKSFFQVDEAAMILRSIVKNHYSVGDVDNLEQLARAIHLIEEAKSEFLRYLKKDGSGITGLTPEFFLNIFRQYNCSFPINGEEWGAPTAANSTPHWIIDLFLKPIELGYENHIMSRMRYLTEEDQVRIIDAQSSPGIFAKLAEEIGLGLDELMDPRSANFVNAVKNSPKGIRKAVDSISTFVRSYANLGATHWTLISFFMLKPMKTLVKRATTVSPERGTSGLSLEEVLRIRDMRRQHPFLEQSKRLANTLLE